MESASTAEGIQLDETAGGTMGIEWNSRLGLSDGVDECRSQVSGKARERGLWSVGRPGIAVRRGGTAIRLIVMRAVCWAAAQSSASPRVLERERAVNEEAGR